METPEKAKLLRIYVSSTDKFKHMPLYEVIVYAAKRYQIKGCTVLRGIMGYGLSSKVTSLKFWEFTEKIPVVIEIVDDASKIEAFVNIIQRYFAKIKYGCLITIEEVGILLYKEGSKQKK
jgi:PII-like signaling protein